LPRLRKRNIFSRDAENLGHSGELGKPWDETAEITMADPVAACHRKNAENHLPDFG
jgi:hypothetical protein